MTRAAMQQALEALDAGVPISPGSVLHDSIRAALAEQAQPVAECIDDICSEHSGRVEAFDHLPAGTKLYTTPPAPVVPQPLADEDIHLITGHCGVSKHAAISIARAVEAEVLKRMGVQR